MKGLKIPVLLFVILVMVPSFNSVMAQCAMCKATVGSEDSGINVSALNSGIAYLASFAYIILSVIGIIWYRHSKYYLPAKDIFKRLIRKFKA